MTSVRLAHSRFYKGIPVSKFEKFDKVVTTLWSFQADKSILTYAATVFKKKDRGDFWYKKQHRETTQERFTQNPIRMHLILPEGPELSSSPVDWFISRFLIYQYGTHNKVSPDVRRVHHEVTVSENFNQKYDPFYREDRYIINGKRFAENPDQLTHRGIKIMYFTLGFLIYPLMLECFGNFR
tara:strand:- start:92 stop:637 length:546 start_codon:yes stop_codon:yes gene_type:complete